MTKSLDWLKSNYKGDQTLINQFSAQIADATSLRTQIVELTSRGDSFSDSQSSKLLMEQYNPLIEEATENLQTFADQVEEASNTTLPW